MPNGADIDSLLPSRMWAVERNKTSVGNERGIDFVIKEEPLRARWKR